MPSSAITSTLLCLLLLPAIARSADPAPPAGNGAGAGAGLGQDTVVVDEKTEQLIGAALKYLVANQAPNGSWSAGGRHAVALTGYTLMAFMSTGNLPDEGPYGKTVTAGMEFLLNAVKPDGFIQYNEANMYGHGIATIALAELYGQTKNPRIRSKLESSVKLIINCQNPEGGWRYVPRVGDADISVTVLQVTALRAAKNAGLDVPQSTIDRAVRYVHNCYDDSSGGFNYQPRARQPGFARTAAAIYSLQVCGQYDDPQIKKGSAFLFTRPNDREWFTYGHFYAAPAQYMIGGETWQKWYTQIRDLLLRTARRQGETAFWTPDLDQGGSRDAGPVYCTAVYITILAMPYHYIPLYQR